MGKWDEAGTWSGEGVRREVFYFGGDSLYGSLYAAEGPGGGDGLLICPSWGYEADRTERLAHAIALAAARSGGAGMVFHYPGYGDSRGRFLGEATMESLAAAAAAALVEAARRQPQHGWFAAGLMLGGAVAALAHRLVSDDLAPLARERLLLVQPALLPSAYFGRLARSTQRVTLGPGRIRDMSFAYPLPGEILAAGEAADAPVQDALRAFPGQVAIVRHEKTPVEGALPERHEELTVEGAWRFATMDNPELEQGVRNWLRRRARPR